ncbi:MAG: DinB family protein [Ilumatobacteraceae bacterium]
MTVERESKSWTWVNERPCEECGFDASAVPLHDVSSVLRRATDDWVEVLGGPDVEVLLRRPSETVWSPTEYGCHVRDVLDLLAYRFERTVSEDRPRFPDWHPNDRAEQGRYVDERDPCSVAGAIAGRSERVVAMIESMSDSDWQRRGVRADGLEFTNAWLSTYLTHDVVHHLHDVRRILGR